VRRRVGLHPCCNDQQDAEANALADIKPECAFTRMGQGDNFDANNQFDTRVMINRNLVRPSCVAPVHQEAAGHPFGTVAAVPLQQGVTAGDDLE
jgi:hypothetical protein